jgi:amino acid transporter
LCSFARYASIPPRSRCRVVEARKGRELANPELRDGPDQALPSQFASVEEHPGTPITALVVLTAISVVVTLVASLTTGPPLEGFAFLGTIEMATATSTRSSRSPA